MNISTLPPFGQFRVSIETTDQAAPVKGMRSAGDNGYYHCFESIHSYKEQLALKLMGIVGKLPHVTAATITTI